MKFRKLGPGDEDEILWLLGAPEIAKSCSIPNPFLIDDARKCVTGNHYGLFSGREGDDLVAIASFSNDELGYAVRKNIWGCGCGSEIVSEFFKHVDPDEVHAEVLSTNVASLRILLKRGFEIIGWRDHENPNWPAKVPVLKMYWRKR